MIADTVSGKVSTADVFFLIAVILFAIGVIVPFVVAAAKLWQPVIAAGLVFVALAFWVL